MDRRHLNHLQKSSFHSLMMALLSCELSLPEDFDLSLCFLSLDLLRSLDLDRSLCFFLCFLSLLSLSFLSLLSLSLLSFRRLSKESSLQDRFLRRYSGCSRYIFWNSSFLKLFESGFTCIQLQYPPRLQLPSIYCLHLAFRKSVTGENMALIFFPLKNLPLILLSAFSEYSSSLYFTQTLPTIWSPKLSTTIISSIYPYWLISLKTSSKNCQNL